MRMRYAAYAAPFVLAAAIAATILLSSDARTEPTSAEPQIAPIGTSYTFTPIKFEGAAPELTFDLRSAKPRPLPRAGLEPQLGAVAVSTTFLISDPPSFHEVRDAPPSGNTLEPGTYRMRGIGGLPDLILSVPSNHLESNRGTPLLGGFTSHIALGMTKQPPTSALTSTVPSTSIRSHFGPLQLTIRT